MDALAEEPARAVAAGFAACYETRVKRPSASVLLAAALFVVVQALGVFVHGRVDPRAR